MAKNKITVQMLSDMMASNTGNSKTTTETFVKNFFSVLKEALQKDNIIKIKGFGTFKLVVVAARESVNVNTGERVSIAEYNKITFTPDKSLKARVNKPFEQFDTIQIEDEDVEMVEKAISENENPIVNQTEVVQSQFPQTALAETHPEENIPEESAVMETAVSEESKSKTLAAELPENEEILSEAQISGESGADVSNIESPLESSAEEQSAPIVEQTTQISEKTEEFETSTTVIETPEEPEEPIDNNVGESNDERVDNSVNNTEPTSELAAEEQDTAKIIEPQHKGKRKVLIAGGIIAGALIVIALVVGAYLLGTKHIIDLPVADKPAKTETPKTNTSTATAQKTSNTQSAIEAEQAEKEKALEDSLALLHEKAANFEQVEGGEYLIVGTKTYRKMSANTNLTKLTLNVYGDIKYLPYVIKYNGIKNPNNVIAGTRLRFPELIEK